MQVTKWNGQPITVPGWYTGIPIEKYHSAGICDDLAVSSSNLRTCWSKSPAHMYHEWCENPDYEPEEATKAMILGAVSHHLFLGEDNFRAKYVAQPETYPDKKTGESKPWTYQANFCKDWRAKQQALGLTVVTMDNLKAVIAMSKALALDPLVNDGLLRGYVETSGFFKHQQTGLWIKVRPDVIPQTDADFVDLKTARDVTTPALQYALREHGYCQQGALVWEACDELDQPFAAFTLMFVETAAPFCARSTPLVREDLSLARNMNLWALKKIRSCIETGHWPGPGEGELTSLGLANDERARIISRLKPEGLA